MTFTKVLGYFCVGWVFFAWGEKISPHAKNTQWWNRCKTYLLWGSHLHENFIENHRFLKNTPNVLENTPKVSKIPGLYLKNTPEFWKILWVFLKNTQDFMKSLLPCFFFSKKTPSYKPVSYKKINWFLIKKQVSYESEIQTQCAIRLHAMGVVCGVVCKYNIAIKVCRFLYFFILQRFYHDFLPTSGWKNTTPRKKNTHPTSEF